MVASLIMVKPIVQSYYAHKKKDQEITCFCFAAQLLSVPTMKLKDKITTLPVGSVIPVDPEKMTLVRYHARGCRDIISRANLKTKKRDVLLGDFYRKESSNGNGR